MAEVPIEDVGESRLSDGRVRTWQVRITARTERYAMDRVTVLAMTLGDRLTTTVLVRRDSLKVDRVDAAWVFAEVVDMVAGRNWTDQTVVEVSMRGGLEDASVTLGVDRTGVVPALVVPNLIRGQVIPSFASHEFCPLEAGRSLRVSA